MSLVFKLQIQLTDEQKLNNQAGRKVQVLTIHKVNTPHTHTLYSVRRKDAVDAGGRCRDETCTAGTEIYSQKCSFFLNIQ